MVAGIVVLAGLWAASRWRTGARQPDPAARVAALLGVGLLGAMAAVGPWSWISERYRLWFWLPFGAVVAVFVADWLRERAARRRQRDGTRDVR